MVKYAPSPPRTHVEPRGPPTRALLKQYEPTLETYLAVSENTGEE